MTKRWEWDSDQQCCSGCPPYSSLEIVGNEVCYYGWCSDVGFGGGYTIARQPVDEFLTQGPLDEKLPAAQVAEIRAYLSTTRAD